MKFKCISTHPEPLADGRVVAPFEEFELERDDAENPDNRHLFTEDKVLAFSRTGVDLIETQKEADVKAGESFHRQHLADLEQERKDWLTHPDNPNAGEAPNS